MTAPGLAKGGPVQRLQWQLGEVAGSMGVSEMESVKREAGKREAGKWETSGAGPRVLIIGAGVSGILMAIKLRARGWRNFVILEKAQALGGTWRDNVYPGVACDVPAHVYVYSFAPNPAWKTRYAKGPDIWKYYHDVARRYGVLAHIEYGKDVDLAEFDGAGWTVTATDGSTYTADIVIGAAGRLRDPNLPEIPGRDSFAGPSFHTARWDQTVSVKDKRVCLIGAGSSGVQVLASIAHEVKHITQFQRTPQWVFPVQDAAIPWWKRLAFRLFPFYVRATYRRLLDFSNQRGALAFESKEARAERDQMCVDALERIRDPELRATLTPDYDVGCKRLVMSETWFDQVQRPNVSIVIEAIERIEPEGVRTADGRLHECDIIVYATGFDAHAYIRPVKVVGEGGVTLDDLWQDLPLTYRSVAIPHMPNFFLLNGPSSPGGSASIVGIVETQAAYLFQILERIVANKVLITPREEVSREWQSSVRERARTSVWGTGGCQSWYLDKTGTPAYDAVSLPELAQSLAAPDFDDFTERPLSAV
ncbi:MAG: NAD(P)/FAD-dependent oxidoreductase [Sphingomonadaceae bacterium]|nr:NAD(P)/FAD-dependent oxidoreductase [Sphingomonadaceae bacterium]